MGTHTVFDAHAILPLMWDDCHVSREELQKPSFYARLDRLSTNVPLAFLSP